MYICDRMAEILHWVGGASREMMLECGDRQAHAADTEWDKILYGRPAENGDFDWKALPLRALILSASWQHSLSRARKMSRIAALLNLNRHIYLLSDQIYTHNFNRRMMHIFLG